MLDIAERRKISNDTIARSEQITISTPGASLESSFITASTHASLSPLDPEFPNLQLLPIEVQDVDSFLSARQLIANDTGLKDKIAVLNLASDEEPGGGWRYSLSQTQEEALCYSATLFQTLKAEWYPWPNTGQGSIAGIFSPNVVVFKDTLDNNCEELKQEKRVVVSVLTVAAPRCPELTADGENFREERVLQEFREKVRLVLRCAARGGKTGLVLGAMGCGAYRCPPRLIAREMKKVLGEEEFKGWFGKVVFAVYGRGPVGKRNLEVFKDVFGNE
ncbi:hypothetical protein AUEXF2481DRAFT_41900 [Aureobasidium subglaciale EXF-2481]|uniref:Microbial-type PARG catalytic domain-containing protein n=1 Tax=Aureobasidium subglaciale (strain EXF-2481) TaxID=1043005 RepID=A0A074Z3T7_AURSE|nr:uncharacterized protein AUEXF2481DRAFT_41900 [Aureobasidium subglaciale EXF-2481]KEQ93666.1 hypothetical protein AUEXF2481DRAFT_41900 [Aureobasidium subglaciale EXF-2481]